MPKDKSNVELLPDYKGTSEKWKDWNFIIEICKKVATEVMENNYA